MEELLKIDDLSKSFVMHRAGRHILGCQHISLSLMPGEFVGITGRSGSGKSTILRCIYRTNLPESGAIGTTRNRLERLICARRASVR